MMHGEGTFKRANEDQYVGEWANDKRSGTGKISFANNDECKGKWKDDKKDGTGTMECANKDKYKGKWKNDQRHDTGTMTYANNDEYKGKWKDEKKEPVRMKVTTYVRDGCSSRHNKLLRSSKRRERWRRMTVAGSKKAFFLTRKKTIYIARMQALGLGIIVIMSTRTN